MYNRDLKVWLGAEENLRHFDGHWSNDYSRCYLGYVTTKDQIADLYYREYYDLRGRVIDATYVVEYENPVGEGRHRISSGSYHHLHEAIGAACNMFTVYR